MVVVMVSIHEKIQKILALGERAGTEGEAQAAMARAHALLAKHNLTMDEVRAHNTQEPEESLHMDESVPSGLRNTYWRDTVTCAIARLYFCKAFMRKRNGARWYCIIGKPSNIAVVKYLTEYVCRTADELAKQGAKEAAQRMATDGVELNTRAWAASFRVGFATRIASRCNEQIEQAKKGGVKDESTGTALVLAPLYNREQSAIEAYMGNQGVKLKTSRATMAVRSTSGYQAG
jgi:hypothetical protein